MTDKTSEFSEAINTKGTFKDQVAKWDKLVKKLFSRHFRKSVTENENSEKMK